MGNAVVHAEIGAADDQPLIAFYGALFGWTVTGGGPGGAGLIPGTRRIPCRSWAGGHNSAGAVQGRPEAPDPADTGAGRGIQRPFRDPARNVSGVR